MRITLDIEDDVLSAAKELARRQGRSVGAMISELVRRSLIGAPMPGPARVGGIQERAVAGFRPFAARGKLVGDDMIDSLRDAEGV